MRRSSPLSSLLPSLWVAAIVAIGAFGYVSLASTPTLAGFVLDGAGVIQPGSQLPPGAGEPGDRVVAVGGTPVGPASALDAALTAAGAGETVDVVVERAAPPEEVEWSPGMQLDDLLGAWGEDARVSGVEGTAPPEGGWTRPALRSLRSMRDGTLIVTVDPGASLTRGPVQVVRRRPEVLGVAWICITLLVLGLVTVQRREELERNRPASTAALTSVAAGGIALASFADVAAAAEPSTLLIAWAAGAMLLSAASALTSELGTAARRLSSILWVVGASAIVPALALARPGAPAGLYLMVAAAVSAGAAGALLAVRVRRAERGPVAVLAGLALAASLAALALCASDVAGRGAAWALMVAAAAVWSSMLTRVLTASFDGRGGRARRGGGARTLIEHVSALDDATSGALVVGYGDTWVELSAADALGAPLRARRVDAERAAAFGLLVAEGRTVPSRSADDDDPVGDWPDRLGVHVAVRLTELDAPVPVVLAGLGEPGPAPAFDLDAIGALANAADVDALSDEAIAATVGVAIRAASTERAPAASPSAPAESPKPTAESGASAVVRAATPAPAPATSPDAEAWARWQREWLDRRYPVDDPEAIDDAERRALSAYAREPAVLVIGEPGVGKEFVGRALHAVSPRADARIGVLDVDTTPPSVVDVALFGADDEPGLVSLIGTGTLILKNASLLPERQLRPLVARLAEAPSAVVFAERYRGRDEGVPATVAAPIRELCGRSFLHLTPLRDRPRDVERFASYFLHRASMRHGGRVVDFTTPALEALKAEAWPLNFVELRAAIERAVVTTERDVIDVADLGRTGRAMPEEALSAERKVDTADDPGWTAKERAERARIVAALEENDGNRTHAAKALGYSRGKLLRRLKKFGLD